MLSTKDNETLTRTGSGTPMGELMRRYWIPVFLSRELPEPDCAPVRVKILGEKLVGFRDSGGAVGLLEEFCPHRRASLWLGRNEEFGLRCIYHGWKFDVRGNCLDMPNEPPESNFKDKIRLTAYPTVEMGDIVWAYLGPESKTPALPKFECMQVPKTHRHVSKTWQECNWLQALEGGLDTAHISFLHWGLSHKAYGKMAPDDPAGLRWRARSPELDVDVTDYGFRYAGIRHLGEQGDYVRTYHYVLPWTQLRANQALTAQRTKSGASEWRTIIAGHFWVPMDDENCMVWNWDYSFGDDPLSEDHRKDDRSGALDIYGDFRKKRNKDNDWLIDREVQRTKTYTGIEGVNTQDHAVQESMGPIVDRTGEHLGSTDKAVIKARQLLLEGVETVRAGGDPRGLAPTYYKLRAIEKVIPLGVSWREELLPLMYQTSGGGS